MAPQIAQMARTRVCETWYWRNRNGTIDGMVALRVLPTLETGAFLALGHRMLARTQTDQTVSIRMA